MKLPKSFRPKKDLEAKLKKLLEGKKSNRYNLEIISQILEYSETLIKEKEIIHLLNTYNESRDIAENIDFTKFDLEEAVKLITVESMQDSHLGFYISAFTAKLFEKHKTITLKPAAKDLYGIGAYHKKGNLIIRGDLSYFTGFYMLGGELIVKGDVGKAVGEQMKGGKITIHGDVGDTCGYYMAGGEIRVKGKIAGISPTCQGIIYCKNKKVWPK